MVSRGLKPGDTFSDGPLFYKVLSVNEDGSYISTRVEAVEEPGEAEAATVVKKPRSNRRK